MDEEKYKVDVEFINVAGGNKVTCLMFLPIDHVT